MSKDKAWEEYDLAYYLLNTTYPAVNDPKLLVTILQKIHSSLNAVMDTILGNNSLTFIQKIIKLQTKGYDTTFIQDLHYLIEFHNQSPLEFSKEGRFVICNDDYSLRTITTKTIQELLTGTKSLLQNFENSRKE